MQGTSPKFVRRKLTIVLSICIFIAITIVVYRNSTPVLFFEGVVQSIFSVPKSVIYSLGKNETNKKIEMLTQRNRELEQKIVEFQVIKNDNEALRSQFNISSETTQNLIATKIIGFQGESKMPSEYIVNAGKKDGIKKGMTVVYEKYLIGKIDSVGQNYSVVTTPISPKFRVLAKFPDTNANGLIVGRSDFMLFDGVVITDTLKNNGVILTKGEVGSDGIGVVPDLIIGKITSISKNETSPFQSAEVMPVIDFSKLTNVFIIAQM